MSDFTPTRKISEHDVRVLEKILERLRSKEMLSTLKRLNMAASLDIVISRITPAEKT